MSVSISGFQWIPKPEIGLTDLEPEIGIKGELRVLSKHNIWGKVFFESSSRNLKIVAIIQSRLIFNDSSCS
jgi:hypothetical protein